MQASFVDTATGDVVKLAIESRGDRKLTKLGKLKRSSRSRVIALAMICLIAHAFFVSVTHHHPVRPELAAPTGSSFIANDGRGSHTAPDSSNDAQCLSCRLQRNFVSNVGTTAVAVQPLEQPSIREAILCVAHSKGASLLLFGRAPPA